TVSRNGLRIGATTEVELAGEEVAGEEVCSIETKESDLSRHRNRMTPQGRRGVEGARLVITAVLAEGRSQHEVARAYGVWPVLDRPLPEFAKLESAIWFPAIARGGALIPSRAGWFPTASSRAALGRWSGSEPSLRLEPGPTISLLRLSSRGVPGGHKRSPRPGS